MAAHAKPHVTPTPATVAIIMAEAIFMNILRVVMGASQIIDTKQYSTVSFLLPPELLVARLYR